MVDTAQSSRESTAITEAPRATGAMIRGSATMTSNIFYASTLIAAHNYLPIVQKDLLHCQGPRRSLAIPLPEFSSYEAAGRAISHPAQGRRCAKPSLTA